MCHSHMRQTNCQNGRQPESFVVHIIFFFTFVCIWRYLSFHQPKWMNGMFVYLSSWRQTSESTTYCYTKLLITKGGFMANMSLEHAQNCSRFYFGFLVYFFFRDVPHRNWVRTLNRNVGEKKNHIQLWYFKPHIYTYIVYEHI